MSTLASEPNVPVAPPSGPADSYHGLGIWARRVPDRGVWQFGVSPDGADIVLWEKKLGGVDDDLKEHFSPGFRKQRADTYRREQLGLD